MSEPNNHMKLLSARLRAEDHAALLVFAARERRNLSDMVRIIIEDRLKQEGCYEGRKVTRGRHGNRSKTQ